MGWTFLLGGASAPAGSGYAGRLLVPPRGAPNPDTLFFQETSVVRQPTLDTLTRRDVLCAAAAGTLSLGLAGRWAPAEDSAPSMGIALQLYSIRNDCARDFDAALKWVAETGFEAVEFAGYHKYGGKPKELRDQLDGLGLKVAGTHIGTNSLVGDALKGTIEFHQVLGCRYLIVPGDGRFSKPDGNKELAEIFNKAAEELKKVGMFTGYHNHTHEFQKDGDKTYWELFAERTSQDVVLQQDVGWTTSAGYDPAVMIRKYPGRSKIIHCKPAVVGNGNKRPIIGEDSVKWAEVFQACREVGGTEWLTLEQEAYLPNTTPMECVQLSLAGMKKILAQA
jgi:sugar phosphate isomerase/epimerase